MIAPLDARRRPPLSGAASFSIGNRLERLAWKTVWLLLARWNPPFFSAWRILLLRAFGADIHRSVNIAPTARIWLPRNLTMGERSTLGPGVDCYDMGPIFIGERTIVSQRAVLCAGTHDIADPYFQLVIKPIAIGSDVWIAAEAFVGPGVRIGDGTVLGARACVFSDLESWQVYVGNPASLLKKRRRDDDRDAEP